MELTLHTPLKEWYVATSWNPLQWWGIDYPPGSAYQSYMTGLLMQAVEPEAVALETSRGYESERSKNAMRLTVLLSDFLSAPLQHTCMYHVLNNSALNDLSENAACP